MPYGYLPETLKGTDLGGVTGEITVTLKLSGRLTMLRKIGLLEDFQV